MFNLFFCSKDSYGSYDNTIPKIDIILKEFASVAGTLNGSTKKIDASKKTATSITDNYTNKNNEYRGSNNEYRPLSGVSDDINVSHLRGNHMRSSSITQGQQQSKRAKTEIVTQGRRHNFEIQPSRYRGSDHTHLGQLPSIDGNGSAAPTSNANKTGYNSEYA